MTRVSINTPIIWTIPCAAGCGGKEEAAAEVLTFRLLAQLERGDGNPTLQTLFLLAKKLGVSVRDLVEVGDEIPLDEPLHLAEIEQPPRRKPSNRVPGKRRTTKKE